MASISDVIRQFGSVDDLLYFLVIARTQSYAAAARELCIDRTTISRRITDFEGRIGTRLLVRVGPSLELTTAGKEAVEQLERIVALLAALGQSLSGVGDLTGRIRISTTEGLGVFWLLTRLEGFCRQHSELELELLNSDSLVVLGREADVALRLAQPSDPSHVARRVGTMPFRLYATSRYIEKYGRPASIDDLTDHRFIDQISYQRNSALAAWNSLVRKLNVAIRVDSAHGLMQAVRHGYGIALCPTYAPRVAEQVGCEDLEELGLDFEVETGVWVVHHEDQRSCPRVRAVVNELYRLFLLDVGQWFGGAS